MADYPDAGGVAAIAEDCVREFLRRLGADLATGKFLLIVESISEDGERGMWYSAPSDQTSWDSLGLLHDALNKELVYKLLMHLPSADDE